MTSSIRVYWHVVNSLVPRPNFSRVPCDPVYTSVLACCHINQIAQGSKLARLTITHLANFWVPKLKLLVTDNVINTYNYVNWPQFSVKVSRPYFFCESAGCANGDKTSDKGLGGTLE